MRATVPTVGPSYLPWALVWSDALQRMHDIACQDVNEPVMTVVGLDLRIDCQTLFRKPHKSLHSDRPRPFTFLSIMFVLAISQCILAPQTSTSSDTAYRAARIEDRVVVPVGLTIGASSSLLIVSSISS